MAPAIRLGHARLLALFGALGLAACTDDVVSAEEGGTEDEGEEDPLLEDPEPSGTLLLQLSSSSVADNYAIFVDQVALADVTTTGPLDLSWVVAESDQWREGVEIQRAQNSTWALYRFENGDASEPQGDGTQYLVNLGWAPGHPPVALPGHNPVASLAPDGRILARIDGPDGTRTLVLHQLSDSGVGEAIELASAATIEIVGFTSDSDYLIFATRDANLTATRLFAVRLGANGPSEAQSIAELDGDVELKSIRALPARLDLSVDRFEAAIHHELLYAVELDAWPEIGFTAIHEHVSESPEELSWEFSGDGACALTQEGDGQTVLLDLDEHGRITDARWLIDFGLGSEWTLSPEGCFGFVTNSVVGFSYVGYADLGVKGEEIPFPEFLNPSGAQGITIHVGPNWAAWETEEDALMVVRYDIETREVGEPVQVLPAGGYELKAYAMGDRVLFGNWRQLWSWDPAGPYTLVELLGFDSGSGFEQLGYSPLDDRLFYTYVWAAGQVEVGVIDAGAPEQGRTVLHESTDKYGPRFDLFAPGYGTLMLK